MSLPANIAAHQQADTVSSLIVDAIAELKDKHGMPAVKVFFGHLRETFAGELTVTKEPPAPKPMNDKEAQAFGEEEMPFGKHRGERIAEIDLSYLDWIAEQPDDFKEKLNRYLMSDVVGREREEGEDDE